jgi:hypothetical protein
LEIKIIKDVARRPGTFCYSIVWNEMWMLPHFLDHYRKLGVSYFVFYDDGSTDGTLELLLAQPDCAVLAAASDAPLPPQQWVNRQIALSNTIPEHFGDGRWSIDADVDEFLLLPTRFANIDALVQYLDVRALRCVQAPMIDFYPARLSERMFGEKSPFEGAPWFDPDPLFIRPYPQVRPTPVAGGVRIRLGKMLVERYPELGAAIFGSSPLRAPQMVKVPLLKTGSGIRRTSPHHVDVPPPMGIQLAFAHFKFFPGSDGKIVEAIERNTHFRDAIAYKSMQAIFEKLNDEPLVTDRSVRYQGPASVEAAGLMWAD